MAPFLGCSKDNKNNKSEYLTLCHVGCAGGLKSRQAGIVPDAQGNALHVMLNDAKGGVIMDVTNVEQARIAEEAGACAVMALERVPADIRKQGSNGLGEGRGCD